MRSVPDLRSIAPRLAAALLLLVAFAGRPLIAATPPSGSGDVDGDGRVTTRDAMLIYSTLGNPSLAYLPAFRAACDVNGDGVCDANDAYLILTQAVVSPTDFDGDGVPNDEDCNPFDDRIAVPYTYYFDYDQAHYRDPH